MKHDVAVIPHSKDSLTVYIMVGSYAVCDGSVRCLSRSVEVPPGGESKFLPLYTSILLLVRVSQNDRVIKNNLLNKV